MQIRYYKEYSRFLNRFMEFKVYGHAGRPIVIFPCQSGRFFDWEDRNMCNAAASWIDSGKLQIFTVDSIDPESWDNNGPERPRIEMQERWYNYVCEEFVPRLLEINREQGEDHTGCILTGGASMGGGHAVRARGKLTCWLPRRSCRPFSRARASIPSWTSGARMSPTTGTGGRSSGSTSCR